jgi:hypothetical protein
MPKIGKSRFISYINTDENMDDVLRDYFKGHTDHQDDSFKHEGKLYCYHTLNVENLPYDEISIVEVYEWED